MSVSKHIFQIRTKQKQHYDIRRNIIGISIDDLSIKKSNIYKPLDTFKFIVKSKKNLSSLNWNEPINVIPRKDIVRTPKWWRELKFVSILVFLYPNGEIGQLFSDVHLCEDYFKEDKRLVCFEDRNDAQGLVDMVSQYFREVIEVSTTLVHPIKAHAAARDAGFDLFVLRKGDLKTRPEWKLEEFAS